MVQLDAEVVMPCMPCVLSVVAAPKGFQLVQDLNDNYQFVYPFGWQEVVVKGTDVVYKDVIEPLESVSVTMSPTDKKDITEFGPVAEVSEHLQHMLQHAWSCGPRCVAIYVHV